MPSTPLYSSACVVVRVCARVCVYQYLRLSPCSYRSVRVVCASRRECCVSGVIESEPLDGTQLNSRKQRKETREGKRNDKTTEAGRGEDRKTHTNRRSVGAESILVRMKQQKKCKICISS